MCTRAPDWTADARYLIRLLPRRPVTVFAGSNGCSVGTRPTVDFPSAVDRLILAWPATAGSPVADARERARLAGLGAAPPIISGLLASDTLQGLTDAELATLTMPVGVLPSVPANPFHQRHTAEAMLSLLQ